MRFALVGEHVDGVGLARALVETGRHELVSCTGVSEAGRARLPGSARSVGDLEEVLADPVVELVIVAGKLVDRAAQLRRALQSERHVVCVYPPDDTPEIGYEAALIQQDTKKALVPIVPMANHPVLQRLREWHGATPLDLVALEIWTCQPRPAASRFSWEDWPVLRALGGEVVEVSSYAASEEPAGSEPILLAGRCERGGVFQATLLCNQAEPRWSLSMHAGRQVARLSFPGEPTGGGTLVLSGGDRQAVEEAVAPWQPWPELVRTIESAIAAPASINQWQGAIRCLELDDAARRSIERRRAMPLEYPEASEEVGFKGTMTLVGCGVLWGLLFLLIVANWYPAVGWAILPILVLFLGLQLLRWIIPRKE